MEIPCLNKDFTTNVAGADFQLREKGGGGGGKGVLSLPDFILFVIYSFFHPK